MSNHKRARLDCSKVPLHLGAWLPVRDVRRLVWRLLNWVDRFLVRCAHNRLYRRRHLSLEKFPAECAFHGYVALLQTLSFGPGLWTKAILESAVRGGHGVTILRQIPTAQESAAAIETAHRRSRDGGGWLFSVALDSGHREMIQWVCASKRYFSEDYVYDYFARIRSGVLLLSAKQRELFDDGVIPYSLVYDLMIRPHHMRGLLTLPVYDVYSSSELFMENLEWLCQSQKIASLPFWRAEYCAHAARRENLRLLKWLRAKGCPWDARVCTFATAKNNAELLYWALEHGCPQL